MVHFRKIGDRNTGQEVRCMKVNPRMDLVALSLSNGDIVLHRLISWQRVWTLPKLKHLRATVVEKTEDGKEHSKITDFTWSPSGRILAVLYEGYFEKDSQSYPANILNHFRSVPSNDASGASGTAAGASSGSISAMALFDIDANKLVASLNSDLPLRCLFWGELDPSVGQAGAGGSLPLDTLDIPYLDLFGEEDDFHQFLGPLAASKVAALGYGPLGGAKGGQPGLKKGQSGKSYHSKNSSLEDYEKVALFGPSPDSVPFNILLTGSSEGAIDVYAYGLYRLLRIDLTLIFTSPRLPSSASLRQLWISNDLSLAKVFLEASSASTSSQLFSLPFPLLATKWRQLVAYIRLKAALDIRLEYLYDTLKEIASIWEDLMAEIDSKLSNYVNRDEESPADPNENPFKPRSNKIRLTPNEFIEMLVFGEISLNLERFLTDLTDKGLKKLASTIEVSFLEIHKANINKVQRALFHILSLLGILKAMSLHDSAFGDLCLSTVLINGFIRETSAMLQKTVQLQCNLNDSMRKTKAFVRWLHKCTFMVPNAEPNSSPSIGGGAGGNSTAGANSGASGAEAADSMLATGYVLTNQDLNLIMNFLRENSLTNGFKFENIAAFLRKGKGGGMAPPATASMGPSLASTSSSSSSAAFTNLKSATKKKSGGLPKSRTSSSRGQSKGNLGSRAKAFTSTTTTPSGTSTATKSKLSGSKKPADSQVPTVPYQEYLSERRFAHFLATLDSLDETSAHLSPNELLSLFFPNILNEDVPGSSPGDLGELEDPWESDLFNEADDLDVLEESAYSHLSLYEHLHQLYARFEGIFAPSGTAASQMNGHCLQAMARQVGVGGAQKDLIERTGPSPRKMDYNCGLTPEDDDFMLILWSDEADKADLIKYSKGDQERQIKRTLILVTEGKDGAKVRLNLEDASFYSEEFLTLVVSEKRDDSEVDSAGEEVKGQPGQGADMSLDEELMSEEETSVNGTAVAPESKATSPKASRQYLIQLAYRQAWEESQEEGESIEIDGSWLLEEARPPVLYGGADDAQSSPAGSEKMDIEASQEEGANQTDGSESASGGVTGVTVKDPENPHLIVRYLGEGVPVGHLAVSGGRKVACLVASSRTRVAVFEMDDCEDAEDDGAEDEEEEEGVKEEDGESAGQPMDSSEVEDAEPMTTAPENPGPSVQIKEELIGDK